MMIRGRWPHPDPRKPQINRVDEWQRWVAHRHERDTARPPLLGTAEYAALDETDRADYNVARMVSNANLPHKETPMGLAFAQSFSLQTTCNAMSQNPGVKMGTMMSGSAGALGKSTLIMELAARFEDSLRSAPELFGPRDGHDDLWVPVAYVPLPTNSTVKGLYTRMLGFYGQPVRANRLNETEMADMVRETVQDCGTLLIVIDDITRLRMTREAHQDTADAIRELQETGATVVGVGINVEESGFMFERGRPVGGRDQQLATQTRRRFKLIPLEPFSYATPDAVAGWVAHLKAVEADVLLLNHRPGDLSDVCAERLFRMTGGFLGSLQERVAEACLLAVQSGVERLTPDILDSIIGDDASESSLAAEEADRLHAEDELAGRKRGRADRRAPGEPGTRARSRRKNGVWNGESAGLDAATGG